MTLQVYKETLPVMQSRGGPYAGLDIPEFYTMMAALFTPAEAAVNNALGKRPETLDEIALKMGRDPGELHALLEAMANKGLCATVVRHGAPAYRGCPFMPGIFEYQFISGSDSPRARRLAVLIHAYKTAYHGARGHEKITFPVTRVIPVEKTIAVGNRVHTYDQVATYIDKYDAIAVGTCYCRHAAKLRGEEIHGMPTDVCMWFGEAADYMISRIGGKKVSKAEAMAVLDRSEAAGLIHMSRNTTDDIAFLCNCDRWHCAIVTHVLKQPRPGWVFNSGYQPRFDAERCVACETCLDRCPPQALAMGEAQVPVVDLDRCFGCAVCATGCTEEAIAMVAKPDYPAPPKTAKDLAAAITAARR